MRRGLSHLDLRIVLILPAIVLTLPLSTVHRLVNGPWTSRTWEFFGGRSCYAISHAVYVREDCTRPKSAPAFGSARLKSSRNVAPWAPSRGRFEDLYQSELRHPVTATNAFRRMEGVAYPSRSHFREPPANKPSISMAGELGIVNNLNIPLSDRQLAGHLRSTKINPLEIR